MSGTSTMSASRAKQSKRDEVRRNIPWAEHWCLTVYQGHPT
jgi:hypothetical protein